MVLKEKLKQIRIIWKINSYIKSFIILARYYYFVVYYAFKREKNIILPYIKQKPNVLFIGTDERQDKSGFLQALTHISNEVISFVKEDGTWGQYGENIEEREKKNFNRLCHILAESKISFDCLIMQAWGNTFFIEDIISLKKQYGFKVINIDLDSRLVYKKIPYFGKQNPGILGLAPCVDLVLVSTKEITNWYKKEGVPAVYFPMASSSSFYHPIKDIERIYDVGFIGSGYGIRKEFINYLIKKGIKVEARGPGWPAGSIRFEENNLFFNQCKIVLGCGNISYCKHFFNPKLRDYDALMSGSVYVTNYTPELASDFKQDEEIVLFTSWKDAVKKIKELLSDELKMAKIRESSYSIAKNKHTYESQFECLFGSLSKPRLGYNNE